MSALTPPAFEYTGRDGTPVGELRGNPGRKLRVLDLFSGIGGFSLGLERATNPGAEINGFETVAFCEIESFPRRVLAKHWPDVPCYDDVRTLTAERLAADGIAVDVICGGFPCQDISFAGLGAGLAGERSGLFYEIARLIGELEPRYVILENVAALLSRGLGDVLGTLASLGYDAEWHCIPASYVGAPHRRDRIWIIAYREGHAFGPNTDSAGLHRAGLHFQGIASQFRDEQVSQSQQVGKDVADAESDGRSIGGARYEGRNTDPQSGIKFRAEPGGSGPGGCAETLADPNNLHEQGLIASFAYSQGWAGQDERQAGPCGYGLGRWLPEPDVGRVAHGVPDRTHRLKALGNAVVPQVVELLGHAILQSLDHASGHLRHGAGFIAGGSGFLSFHDNLNSAEAHPNNG